MKRGSANSKDSFERFYLTKVALGDCCGCAERVIDWRDIDLARSAHPLKRPLFRRLQAMFKRSRSRVKAG